MSTGSKKTITFLTNHTGLKIRQLKAFSALIGGDTERCSNLEDVLLDPDKENKILLIDDQIDFSFEILEKILQEIPVILLRPANCKHKSRWLNMFAAYPNLVSLLFTSREKPFTSSMVRDPILHVLSSSELFDGSQLCGWGHHSKKSSASNQQQLAPDLKDFLMGFSSNEKLNEKMIKKFKAQLALFSSCFHSFKGAQFSADGNALVIQFTALDWEQVKIEELKKITNQLKTSNNLIYLQIYDRKTCQFTWVKQISSASSCTGIIYFKSKK